MKIGIISDTHGLIRPEVHQHLNGCEHILHAGDIGKDNVIQELNTIAPVTAIRGNVDIQAWARQYPEILKTSLAGKQFYLIHNLKELSINPTMDNIDVIISGHSHQPLIETKDDVLFINPGSAGPRRFTLPVSLGILEIEDNKMNAKIITLAQ